MNSSGIISKKRFLLPVIFCLQVLIFVWDTKTPDDQADWNWNFLPLLLSIWLGGRLFTYGVAIIGSLSIMLGFYFSPPTIFAFSQMALESRLFGVGLFWVSTLLVISFKNTKIRLQRSERALRMINECDQIIVRATEEAELLRAVCDTIVNVGGYRMSFVGFAQNDARKSILIAAHAGCEEGYLEKAQISWSDEDQKGLGPTGLAIRQGETIVSNDFQNDKRTALWSAEGRKRGYFSSITIPLVNDHKNFGVLVLYGGLPNIFSAEEVRLLKNLADDLAFGIQNLRTRAAQKTVENELANAREQLETLVASMPDAVFFKDGQGRWLITNEAAKQLFQLEKRPWLGRTDAEMANDLPVLKAAHENCIHSDEEAWQGGTLSIGEEQIQLPNGQTLIAEVYKRPLFLPDGQRKGLIAIARNITERKNQEREIARARHFYLSLLDNAPALVWRADKEAKCDWFNGSWLKFTGRKMEQEIGYGWVEGVHTDDLKRCVDYFLDAFQHRRAFEMEYRLLRHDGEYRWISDHGVPFQNLDGGFGGYIGFCYDITERKKSQQALIESQEKLTVLINSFPDNVVLKDGEGRWLVANPAALKFFRLEKIAWQGRTDAELAALNPPLKELHEVSILSGEICWEAKEITHMLAHGPGPDDKLEEHEVTRVPLFDANGKREAMLVIGRDVTEMKRLQRSAQMYELMSRQSRDMLLLIRQRDGQICSANEAALRAYGFSLEEMLAKTIYDLRSLSASSQAASELSAAFASGVLFETVHRRQDGSFVPVEISSQGFTYDCEHYLVSAIRDISERKKLQSQMEDQRRFLADLLENSPLAVFVKDSEERFLLVNRKAEEVIGRKREEIIGRTDTELFPDSVHRQLHKNDKDVLDRNSGQTFEEVLTDENGKSQTFITTKFPIRNENGQVTGLCGIALEVTNFKRAEVEIKRLATVVDQAVEGIFITNLAGNIIYANPAFEKITGYTPAEVIGKNPRLLKSGKQSAKFYNQMWDKLKRGETWKGHFVNRRKDGSLYEEDAVISPIRDGSGTVVSYVAVKHDVTRELQLEAQFRQAQKMEAIGTLAGGIAHDFNNILMAIFVYGGMLKNDLAGQKESVEMVEQIVNSANRAKELVQQILTFSRQQEQKRQIIRLDSVIKEATKFLRASLPVDIQVELNLSTEAPAVLADPTQIYQVIMNLATNATHAMEGKPGRLTISLETFTPDQALLKSNPKFQPINYARLTATDTGAGMDAKTLERIFEPFFTTKGVGKGTGLGLAVVHGIALSHDAVITVESEPQKGASFSLFFPAQKMENDSATQNIRDLPLGNG